MVGEEKMLDETLNIKCSICGKTESKKWYMTGDKFICEECKKATEVME